MYLFVKLRESLHASGTSRCWSLCRRVQDLRWIGQQWCNLSQIKLNHWLRADTSQKRKVSCLFISEKVMRLRALLDPPPPHDGVSEFTGRYPLVQTAVQNTVFNFKGMLRQLFSKCGNLRDQRGLDLAVSSSHLYISYCRNWWRCELETAYPVCDYITFGTRKISARVKLPFQFYKLGVWLIVVLAVTLWTGRLWTYCWDYGVSWGDCQFTGWTAGGSARCDHLPRSRAFVFK